MEPTDKKNALLSVMHPAQGVLPRLNKPKIELNETELRKVKEAGEKNDPIAGEPLRNHKKEPTTVYIAAIDKKRLRLLAAMEGRRVNDYYVEAVNDFLKKYGDKIPNL